jgi:hypothetical protein
VRPCHGGVGRFEQIECEGVDGGEREADDGHGFLAERLASDAESMMTIMVVAVPIMLTMLLKTSATLELARLSRVPWTM